MKKLTVALFISIFMISISANAQTYKTAVGAKFYAAGGSIGGINIKHATAEHTALEGSLLFYSGGIGVEGLYQYQGAINGAPGLQYFVGGGGLLGFSNSNHGGGTSFALRLTGGLDYKFADAPINVALGVDPFFYIAPSTGSQLALGIAFRYVIK